jgi:hypothetical protein
VDQNPRNFEAALRRVFAEDNRVIHPRFWFKHMRARRAVRGYPLYDVPHEQAEGTLPENQVQENFDYFMKVRLERLAFFRKWLLDNFGVNASLDGDGVRAVSRWVDDYGGGVIGDDTGAMTIFATYQPRWVGDYAGYNVMIDLGIFLGEYLISKRPRLHWEIYRGHAVEPATFKSIGYRRPHLGGMPRGWGCDVLMPGYGLIAGSRDECKFQLDRPKPEMGALIRRAKSDLYCSNLPDGEEPIIIGDSSNEQL